MIKPRTICIYFKTNISLSWKWMLWKKATFPWYCIWFEQHSNKYSRSVRNITGEDLIWSIEVERHCTFTSLLNRVLDVRGCIALLTCLVHLRACELYVFAWLRALLLGELACLACLCVYVLACLACLRGCALGVVAYLSAGVLACLHFYLIISFICVLFIAKSMVWQLKNSCTYI